MLLISGDRAPASVRELVRLIEGIVQEMPLRQRQVFILGKELSLKRKVIAKELGLSEQTAKNHMNKALLRIKRKFKLCR